MSMSLTLYNLEENLVALLDTAEMVEGKDERLQILNEIAGANQQAIEKRDNVIRFLRHLEMQQANIDTEIARLKALRDSYANGQARVEKYVVSIIEQFAPQPKKGAKRLEGTIGVLSLHKNPDRVEITDEQAIPLAFMIPPPPPPPARPDKTAIKKAIMAGEEVPGADLVFGDNRLEIK